MAEALLIFGQVGMEAYRTRTASQAARAGAKLERKGTAEAIGFERDLLKEENRRYQQEQDRLDAIWEAEQQRRLPYRQASLSILGDYGFDVPDSVPTARPSDWRPSQGSYRPSGSKDPMTLGTESAGFGFTPQRRFGTLGRYLARR